MEQTRFIEWDRTDRNITNGGSTEMYGYVTLRHKGEQQKTNKAL